MDLKYVEFDSSFIYHCGSYSPWEKTNIYGLCFLLSNVYTSSSYLHFWSDGFRPCYGNLVTSLGGKTSKKQNKKQPLIVENMEQLNNQVKKKFLGSQHDERT